MLPISRLWTWIGTTFVPICFGWGFYVRNAVTASFDGQVVSRAYWGLLVTFLLGAALLWTWFLYVRLARGAAIPAAPMNTLFEDVRSRSALIGWVTVAVYASVVCAGAVLFAAAYSGSRIHGWNDAQALADGFFSSRSAALARGCDHPPRWAMASRIEGGGHPLAGVNEWIPYVSDGALVIAALVLVSGFIALAVALRRA